MNGAFDVRHEGRWGMMKIVIAGGTGTVGKELARLLIDKGHQVIILTRKSNQSAKGKIKYLTWLSDGANPAKRSAKRMLLSIWPGCPSTAGRWSRGHQQQIYESRMKATDEIIRIMQALPEKPQVLINASAVGIYPASFTKIYTEASEETAHHFWAGRSVIGKQEQKRLKPSVLGFASCGLASF